VPYAGNPILTQRHLDRGRPFPITTAGHADFVETPSGEWWAVFLAVRPYDGDRYNTGRETYLMPVRWVDGWPVIVAGAERVPYVHRRPSLALAPSASAPLSGNFSWRDEFNGPALGAEWQLLRTPRDRWYDFNAAPGSLTLRARPAGFVNAQPSFIGRRQQHLNASASTSMTYVPARDGDKAGIVAFQNENHYYFFGIARVGGEPRLVLERHAGPDTSAAGGVIASRPIGAPTTAPVYLRIDARGGRYDFWYGTRENEWTPLITNADGTVLSTQVAGGFVGTMLGLYAYRAPQ
jgi:alpha-N-arabinofuranosidase